MSEPILPSLRVGRRRVGSDDYPLSVGGPSPGVPTAPLEATVSSAAIDPGPVRAWIAMDDGALFVQPADGHDLVIDGRRTEDSHWIDGGDVVGVGPYRLIFDAEQDDDGPYLALRVESLDEANRTLPPEALPTLRPPSEPRPRSGRTNVQDTEGGVRAVDFQPARSGVDRGRKGPRRGRVLAAILVLLLAVVALAVFTARSVSLTLEPEAERVTLSAMGLAPVGPQLGDRRLLWPGSYRVRAEKAGYAPLDQEVTISSQARQELTLRLRRLPSKVTVTPDWQGQDPTAARFLLDDRPLDGEEIQDDGSLVLERPEGSYRLRIEHPRFQPVDLELELAGGGDQRRETVTLEPLWAEVAWASRPPARISVDGKPLGETPITVDLLAGTRRYELVRGGFKPLRGKIEVAAGQARTVGPLVLQPSDGNLAIVTSPSGAEIIVNGRYRGRSPMDLALEPGKSHRIQARKSGHEPAATEVKIDAADSREVSLELAKSFGEVSFDVFPPDVRVLANGEPLTLDEGRARLWAVPQVIEVRREGYVDRRFEITPSAAQVRHIEAHLETVRAVREKKIRSRLETVEGHRLALVNPGRLRMGASRREAGRRANETLREVELTRRFYASVHEITNEQFLRFDAAHRSGTAGGESLELDDLPVVRVTWQQAAAYCNWLSEKEGLPAFYRRSGDDWVAAEPLNEGFRLLSEAEWVWLARYDADGQGPRKYSWGDHMPPPEGAGNFADLSAQSVMEITLKSYRDGFAVTAPVTSFGADRRGIRQLGGNVAEWVHDVYQARPAMVGAVERNPLGPPKGEMRVIRGSSWMHATLSELRLSYRDYGKDPRPDVGFRIGRYVEGEVP